MGRLRPPVGPGQSLGRGPGGQSPRKLQGFKHLINKFPKKSKIKILFNHVVFFFLKGGCTCTCGTPPGYGLENVTHIYNSEKPTRALEC